MQKDPYVQLCADIVRKNIHKIIMAFIIMFFCSQVLLSVSMVALSLCFSVLSTFSFVCAFAVLFLMIAALFTLFYGFCIMMLLFVRGERVVIGHLFIGFSRFGRMLAASVPYTLILFASSCIASVVSSVLLGSDVSAALLMPASPEQAQFSSVLMCTAFASLVLSIVLSVPFLFLPFELYSRPGERVRTVIKSAVKLLISHIWFVLSKCIKTVWKELVGVIVFGVMEYTLFAGNAFPILSAFISGIIVVCSYVLCAKSVILIAICFHRLSGSCDILIEQK